MQVPVSLSLAFQEDFQSLLEDFLELEEPLTSKRFLSRSIVPHVKRLSEIFNRIDPLKDNPKDNPLGVDPYWKKGSHPKNLKLAYFLTYMPPNLYRTASVWCELGRLGFQWPRDLPLKAIEFGSGPASATCGIAAGETHRPLNIPHQGTFALIEKDRSLLTLGENWARHYFSSLHYSNWDIKPFHRNLTLDQLLPPRAPRFTLWLMSFFLNEFQNTPVEMANDLFDSWEKHLEKNGLVILIEPALRTQSRRILELRKALLEIPSFQKNYSILLPCLGHQACGALTNPSNAEDWCHEEVTWWRPPYEKIIDQLTGLDRKSLPFTYLVIQKKPPTPISESLSELSGVRLERLVSPSHQEGRDLEFFLCGQDGKKRARYRTEDPLERGSILIDPELTGDRNSTRINKLSKTL